MRGWLGLFIIHDIKPSQISSQVSIHICKVAPYNVDMIANIAANLCSCIKFTSCKHIAGFAYNMVMNLLQSLPILNMK